MDGRKLVAMNDRVIIKRDDKEKVSKGGIFIPDSAQRTQYRGTVIGVGPGEKGEDGKVIPMTVKVGQKVLFGSYGAEDFEWNGETVSIIREEFVLAVVE